MIAGKFLEDPYRSFETTDFFEAVWDPSGSIPAMPDLDSDVITMEYLTSLVNGGLQTLQELGVQALPPKSTDRIYGMEVGDDRVDISDNPLCLALAIYCQSRVLRFETSWKDTGISDSLWNFCEVTSVVPSTQLGDIQRAKRKGFTELEFVDTPPLRIIIDVQKGDRSHSSTTTGKAQMLGSRIRSARTSLKPTLEVATWMQDSNLGTCNAPDPKYLPQVLGGSGHPPLWGVWQNTYLYLQAYKHGT